MVNGRGNSVRRKWRMKVRGQEGRKEIKSQTKERRERDARCRNASRNGKREKREEEGDSRFCEFVK